MTATRIETDSLGSLHLPTDVLYGIATVRGQRNFDISSTKLGHVPELLRALARIKRAAAAANRDLGVIPKEVADAICAAAIEVEEGQHAGHFVIDLLEGSGGTQSELSPRELAVRFTDERRYFVSEATVYRLLKAHDLIASPAFVVIKAADEFRDKTTRPNEMWQTDFTYFKIIGWGWVYLSTVLDDFSRYILAWKLCTTMRAEDVTDTLELALTASGCDSARVLHKPKLLSDNGPSYIAAELAEWIDANGMSHVRGAPLHPQTQGKIERWHQTLKNRILLENYFLPGDLERQIEAFIEHYNHQRYHESLGNVTPADAYFGRAADIIEQRERIKRQTVELRRLQHRKLAA